MASEDVNCVKCDATLDGENLRSWQEWSCGADERVPKCIPCLATDKVTVCHACESVSKDADINICETCDKPFCENCNEEDGNNCVKCGEDEEKLTCDGCKSRGTPYADVFKSCDASDFLVCDDCGLFLCKNHVRDCRC